MDQRPWWQYMWWAVDRHYTFYKKRVMPPVCIGVGLLLVWHNSSVHTGPMGIVRAWEGALWMAVIMFAVWMMVAYLTLGYVRMPTNRRIIRVLGILPAAILCLVVLAAMFWIMKIIAWA